MRVVHTCNILEGAAGINKDQLAIAHFLVILDIVQSVCAGSARHDRWIS